MATYVEKESLSGEIVPKFYSCDIASHTLAPLVSSSLPLSLKNGKIVSNLWPRLIGRGQIQNSGKDGPMVGGRVSKAHNNVVLTAVVLKRALKVPLSPDERWVEAHSRKRGG